MLVIRAFKLGYPFRTIGKDGGDQTLARPGIHQNDDLHVTDPSPIAGKGGYPSRRFFFSQEAGIIIRQACRAKVCSGFAKRHAKNQRPKAREANLKDRDAL